MIVDFFDEEEPLHPAGTRTTDTKARGSARGKGREVRALTLLISINSKTYIHGKAANGGRRGDMDSRGIFLKHASPEGEAGGRDGVDIMNYWEGKQIADVIVASC